MINSLAEPLARLRQFARSRPPAAGRCELCSENIGESHPHLVETTTGRLICSCSPCAILFSNNEQGAFRRVPRDTRRLADFQLTDQQWENLDIPIALAFLFYSTRAERVV